uniref:Apolipoprotein C-I, acidic form n=1 Tax=Rhinopithecus bieti TaxID=61621 RepID=A0A2K6KMS7_RHIBE
PTPAQGVPDVSNPFDVLEEFGKTLEDNVREVIKLITQSELPAKTRLEPFPGQSRAGGLVFRDIESEGETQD